MTYIEFHKIGFSLDLINNLGESVVTVFLGDDYNKIIAHIDLERNVILYNSFLSENLISEISKEILSLYNKKNDDFTFRANSTSQYFNIKEDFKELEEF